MLNLNVERPIKFGSLGSKLILAPHAKMSLTILSEPPNLQKLTPNLNEGVVCKTTNSCQVS